MSRVLGLRIFAMNLQNPYRTLKYRTRFEICLSFFKDDSVHSGDKGKPNDDSVEQTQRILYIYVSFARACARCILFAFQEFSRAFFSSNFASSFLILFVAVGPSASSSLSSSLLGIARSSASRLSRESPWPEFPSAASLKNGRPSHRSACPPSRVPGSSPGWLSRPPEASATCPKEMIRSPDGRSRRYRRHPLLQIPSLRFAPGNLAGSPERRGKHRSVL